MKTLITVLAALLVTSVFGQNEVNRIKNYNIKGDLALAGYDPVTYFKGKPAEGKETIGFRYKGILYHFAANANLNEFKLSPEKYEPAYGGWCAYAMGATGEKVKIDPETYKIIDGRLYLFYNFWGRNTLEDWNRNLENLKIKADKNWSNVIHQGL